MSESEVQRLKLAIEKKLKRGRGRYAPELKAELLGHIRLRLAAGEKAAGIARSLGLSKQTLVVWQRELGATPAKRKLRAVVLAKEEGRRERGLTLHGPGGLRVEGLSVEELAALWRRLG